MNLRQIRAAIYARLDHNPELDDFDDYVVGRINHHYGMVNTETPLRFLQREFEMNILAPIEGGGSITLTRDTTHVRLLVISANIMTPALGGRTDVVLGVERTIQTRLDGARLTDDQGSEYRIAAALRIENQTILYLDKEYTGTTPTTTWTIDWPTYDLPIDCVEPLTWSFRNPSTSTPSRRIPFISAAVENDFMLDRTDRGDPWIAVAGEHQTVRPPLNAPSLAGATVTGADLVSGFTYQYMYTRVQGGRESPPSTISEITLGSGQNSVAINGLDSELFAESVSNPPTQWTGTQNRLYRRCVDNESPWIMVTQTITSVDSINDSYTLPQYYLDPDAVIEFYPVESYQTVRLWQSPDKDDIITIRYHFNPPPLVAATHVPIWPSAYHQALVDIVLADLLMDTNARQAQLHQKWAADRIKRMCKGWLNHDQDEVHFGRFDKGGVSMHGRYGVPTNSSALYGG